MKKRTLALIIILSVLLAAAVGISIWLISVDSTSRKYNLIKVSTKNVPEPYKDIEVYESDIMLSTGVNMHYARYGEGDPLILIHGNGGSHLKMENAALYFANEYTVYAIDSRCQGQSSQTEALSYALMAADVNAFCEALCIEKPLVVGHSDGGIVALQMAMDYPDLMKGFVACGANSTPDAFKPYFTTPIKLRYKYNPQQLDRIMLEEPNFTAERLAKISCPAYIVAGEFDIMHLSDTAFLHKNINNASVAIIKWGNHSNYVHNGAMCYAVCKPFFDNIK